MVCTGYIGDSLAQNAGDNFLVIHGSKIIMHRCLSIARANTYFPLHKYNITNYSHKIYEHLAFRCGFLAVVAPCRAENIFL